ncbi:hypothetical protein BGW41_006412 [Actinomortierella wolfii]|nr:hypothetical protein BGW41_006412 [Actinomortierella wolfii]
MASVLASRHLPLPVPQRRQSTPVMGHSSQQQSASTELPSPISSIHQASKDPFCVRPPTRSFSHDVAPTAASSAMAEKRQKQLASQLQYLHQLDKMHRQRIRDIQLLHEQQQLFASPHHRLTRRHKTPGSTNRLYHDSGSPLQESFIHLQQSPQHKIPLSSSQINNQQQPAAGTFTPSAPAQPTAAQAAGAWSEEQEPPRPDHYVRRFQLAQRMLQIQQMIHTQRIQQLHHLHKLSKVQQNHQQQSIPELNVSKPSTPTTSSMPSSPTMTNNSTVVVLCHDNSEANNAQNENNISSPAEESRKTSSANGVMRITLPNIDTIRKQRRQRLKAQVRLRQAAAERALKAKADSAENTNEGGDSRSLVKEEAASAVNTLVGSATSGTLSDKTEEAIKSSPLLSLYAPYLTPPLTPAQLRQNSKKSSTSEDAALRLSDCSISRARLKTKAELAYKKQLVRQQSLQHHMIQDHTNRYRIYQAYCLLQRAREAQAMDELKAIELKRAQTRAWVESLRSQVDLEAPK